AARDRPRRCGPLEVEGPARGRPGQASGSGPEDLRRDRDPRTRRREDSRGPLGRAGEGIALEIESGSVFDVAPQAYPPRTRSADCMAREPEEGYVKELEAP